MYRPFVAAQGLGLPRVRLIWRWSTPRIGSIRPIDRLVRGDSVLLADMATQVEAARHLVTPRRGRLMRSEGRLKISAMCKVFATDTAMKVATDAVQLFGGYGYCRDYRSRSSCACESPSIRSTNQIQRMVIGRALIKEGASG
jgi:alkylation response protein AidB-like acyl-CoA dehydrogenase